MSSPIALQELFKAGFEDFAIPSYETAPYTTIQNRAQVTRSLKAIAGIERVMFGNTLNLLQNEFGPNGERVYSLGSGDSRFRAVGNWFNQSASTGGNLVISTNTINDYVEVTFYGTGLNAVMYESASVRDYRASVDGGAEGSNLKPSASFSGILTTRNYAVNHPIPVVSGLSLGWHTVKIRNNDVSNGPSFYGFEILNERSNLAVYAGAGISNGSFNGLSSLATSAFNQGVVGTRGARVVKYIENGTLKSAVREVDATSKYVSLADHTNEEIVRRINFREFGANRADDFSTLTTATSRLFTLDDGVTTLAGSSVAVQSAVAEKIYVTANANFISLTFVGTGLDIIRIDTLTGAGVDTFSYSIDGTTVGTISGSGSQVQRTEKIASGLPYGTHVFKLNRTSASTTWDVGISDFIIYQPKKPSIPAGALEVADYNIMANFSPSASNANGIIGTGVIRKSPVREFVYTGTWTSPTINGAFSWNQSSYNIGASTAGAACSYTFWGTGFEFKLSSGAGVNNSVITVDGSANLSAYTTSLVQTSTGATFTAATGTIAGTNAATNAISVRVSGLSLGLHTVKITHSSVGIAYQDVIDIITPIHINNPTLKVGSQSLKSVTKYSPEKVAVNAGPDLSKAKAWVVYDQVNSKILSSYRVSSCLANGTGVTVVFFEKPFKTDYGTSASVISQAAAMAGGYSTGTARTLSYATITSVSYLGTYTNTTVFAAFFGELIDE